MPMTNNKCNLYVGSSPTVVSNDTWRNWYTRKTLDLVYVFKHRITGKHPVEEALKGGDAIAYVHVAGDGLRTS